MIRRGLLSVVLGVSGLWLAGCGTAVDEDPALNVLILTLDTTRADHLGCYGYEGAVTPHLDRFASERAVLFENAMTPVPITFPSHTSIMTGTYPVFHGVHDNDGFVLDDEVTTLAEILTEEGFTTGAVIASYPLDSQFNLDQGFATYNDDYREDWTLTEIEARTPLSFGFEERRADQVNAAAFRWLDEHAGDRFFLWMHYFDPHQNYDPPPPYDTHPPFAYDGEIAFADENFGAVLDYLDSHHLSERTVIVVVGDHGESLGDHGEPTHAAYVYDQTMRVPLLISAPGEEFAAGSKVAEQVRTLDIAPTILDILGLPLHPDMQGQSLQSVLSDPSSAIDLPALGECLFPLYHFNWAPLRSLRTGTWKYVLGPVPELYDLEADPGEQYNLASTRPEIAARLDRELDELFAAHASPRLDRSTVAIVDSEVTAKLAALGYMAGGDPSLRAKPFPSRDELATMTNPMSKSLVLDYINFATEQVRTKRYEEAIEATRTGLQLDPDNLNLQVLLGRAQYGLGNYDKAAADFERAVEINPSDAPSHLALGNIYLKQQRLPEAKESLELALKFEPNNIKGLGMLGTVYALQGDYDRAIDSLEKAVEKDPNLLEAWIQLGSVCTDAGQFERAREALQQALHLEPYSTLVMDKIAILYLKVGNVDFGRQALYKAIDLEPTNPVLRLHLADALLLGEPDPSGARAELEYIIEIAPDSPWAEAAREKLDRIAAVESAAADAM